MTRVFPLAALLTLGLASCGDRPPAPETSPGKPASTAPVADRGGTPLVNDGFSDDQYAAHLLQLRKRVPEGFTVIVERPFVVIGDEPAAVVRERAERIVRFSVSRLKRDFFDRDPEEIIDIWLFKDEASYRAHALEIFGDVPDTPYGYYSAEDRAMVMNIKTGGGTLVHEIVHPFMRANFPAAPSWLDEGLGSLFEQSTDAGGHIKGLTNWRLAGLQEAIEQGRLPSFETLISTTRDQFYEEDPGTNYAQARYLLYYLQQHDRLIRYYREFVASHVDDPTGLETLKRVLGISDMQAFQRQWEAWVLELTFP
jgi:hypothetical protein